VSQERRGIGTMVIVGAGRIGLTLGAALRRQDAVERLMYFGRALEPPPHPLFDPQPIPGSVEIVGAPAEYRTLPSRPPARTEVIVLAVPDAALPEVTYDLVMAGPPPPGCAVLHVSGALSTDVLMPLHGAGYAIGSLHPLMAAADPRHAGDQLLGAAFALGGEPAAVTTARRIVSMLGGRPLVIAPSSRPLYHAAAVIGSNYLVALAAAASRMLEEAGVEVEDTLPALLPLMRGTLDNIERLGVSAALTGPIARGDADTVRLHLARLSAADRVLYCGLGLELLRLAREAGLAGERAEEIELLLTSG
jgi:predicted short-subunit dehydrogenase-like oxidoreductase (DUF2520 family)